MTLYTSKAIAEWLGLTERRVRQLRDEGVISEARPGLYALRPTVSKYITYLRKGSNDLNEERAKLTTAKREAAEMENARLRWEFLEVGEIEKGLRTMNHNIRSRFLAMPAKLAPVLSKMAGDQAAILDALKQEVYEALEELTDYRKLLEEIKDADKNKTGETGEDH